MMAAALVFRAVMIPFGPLLDNDVYRYLWDGHVGASGTNPYLYPPESMPFEGTDFPYFARINYPWVSTIYPPLAQVMFVIAVRLHLTTPIAFKLLLLPFDLGTIVLLIRMLRRLERPVGLVVIYAWSPLALKEVFNSAHVDVVMIFLMLLAVHLAILRQPAAAGLSIGLSVMTKGASAVIAPILAKRRPYRVIATAIVAIGALWLPYASAGTKMFGGASAYARYWRFNDGAFYILYRAGQALTGGDDPSATVAKVGAAVISVAYLAICTRRRATAASGIITSCRNVLMALLLLMPVVNPWYVCWLVPFLCLMPSRGMLALSILCPLSYLYYQDNSFPSGYAWRNTPRSMDCWYGTP
jgi:hypothetical protein